MCFKNLIMLSLRGRGTLWPFGLVIFSAAVCLGLFSTSAVAEGHERSAVACSDVAVEILGASPREQELICSAAAQGFEFFRRCKFEISQQIRVAVVEDHLKVCGVDAFGSYSAESGTIELLDLKACSLKASENQAYSSLPPPEFYSSIVVHEVAHAIFRSLVRDTAHTHATHEYVAYAVQISSMRTAVRQQFLNSIQRQPATDLEPFVDIVFLLGPSKFAAMAYDHYSMPGNGCRFLEGLVDGRIEFPRMEEFD